MDNIFKQMQANIKELPPEEVVRVRELLVKCLAECDNILKIPHAKGVIGNMTVVDSVNISN